MAKIKKRKEAEKKTLFAFIALFQQLPVQSCNIS
jgi:hypothetical protein